MNKKIQELSQQLINNISTQLIGKEEQIRLTWVCLIAGGHILLEDVPGLGKTTLAKALATSLDVPCKRVQCTPDLMPSDITGVTIYNQKTGDFDFIEGPVFTNILLADEINRSNPRTQSALLEAMAEGTVSVDRDTYTLTQPFFVIATQNPLEFSGTYPLPEAQMDRFMMRISLGYPNKQAELKMLQSQRVDTARLELKKIFTQNHILQIRQHAQNIAVSDEVYQYIINIVDATRSHDAVALGASPRASLALMKVAQAYALVTGANHVTPAIIQKIAEPVLAHRIIFKNKQMHTTAQMQFFDSLLNNKIYVPDHAKASF